MKVVFVHFSYLPVVAGVELLIEQHLSLLKGDGHEVTMLVTAGPVGDGSVLLPDVMKGGEGDPEAAIALAEAALKPWFLGADRVIVHNLFTMPFALPYTAALWRWAERLPAGRVIQWVHDLAAVNEDYAGYREGLDREWRPIWDLLSKAPPNVRSVAISEWRATQFLALTGQAVDAVIPNGIDPLEHLTPTVKALVRPWLTGGNWPDWVLLQPARLLRRKNIEMGMRLMAECKRRGISAVLWVTGAPDCQQGVARAYEQALVAERRALGVEEEVIFLSERFTVDKKDLMGLYDLCDGVWFPSKQEGFGLPVLEGGLHQKLVLHADVPPMSAFGLPNMHGFSLNASAEEVLALLEKLRALHGPYFEARREVVRRFSWEVIWPQITAFLFLEPQERGGDKDDRPSLSKPSPIA